MRPWSRCLAVALTLAAAPTFTLVGQTLSGRVLDSLTAQPVRGVEMVFTDAAGDTVATTRTNYEGRFAVELSHTGTYVVHCRCIGHRPKEATIEVAGDAELTIRLAPLTVPPAKFVAGLREPWSDGLT